MSWPWASTHSRLSTHVYTAFQGINVAASMQTYGIYIPGKRPCGPKLRVMIKHPWALTWDTTVLLLSPSLSVYLTFNIAAEDDVVDTLLRSLSYREDVTSHDYVCAYYLPPSAQLKGPL